MEAVIAKQLTKIYNNGKKALNEVNFTIGEGEIFGFLGPNGAGKTTAVKVLNGMLKVNGGYCNVFDIEPGSAPEKIHAVSGVMTEHAQMYNNLSGLNNLIFFGTIFGISPKESKSRSLELLVRLDLLDAKDQKLATYSTGMRQRLSLARVMLHHPKILFLDEPTSGLDPESAQNVITLIKNIVQEKRTTVFLCTHQLRYAEEICTSYGLISEGSIMATGSIDELRSLVSSGLTVKIKADLGNENCLEGLKINRKDGFLLIDADSHEDIPLLVKRIVDNGGKIYHVTTHKLSLEDIYFALIERQKKEENNVK